MKAHDIPVERLEPAARRVLIIDDDPQTIEAVQRSLDADQHVQVTTAGDGYDAGLLTGRLRPHVILLASDMPNLRWNVVSRAVRAAPDLQQSRILLMVGPRQRSAMERLAKKHVDGIVHKPLENSALRQSLEALLEREGIEG
jgi:PleD family two-component response regulator